MQQWSDLQAEVATAESAVGEDKRCGSCQINTVFKQFLFQSNDRSALKIVLL